MASVIYRTQLALDSG